MVRYWLLSYPRQNLEISLAKKVIGGRSRDNYRRVYEEELLTGDQVVLHVTGEGKIKVFVELRVNICSTNLRSGQF